MGGIRVGSEEHKALFCRELVQSHDPFEPSQIHWPDLDSDALARLKALPIWNEALRARTGLGLRPIFDARRAWVIGRQLVGHVRQATRVGGDGSGDGFT